jgi:23S rRNA (guanosine2251-2'-O)-methyltransferase
MIIRSAAAGAIDGIILPGKGSAALGPLTIKASAGTLYRAPLLLCESLPHALQRCQQAGAQVCLLDAHAKQSLFDHRGSKLCIYVLGNESEGVSDAVSAIADARLSIPMRNHVESLNVAVTASLIAFAPYFER